MSTQGENGVESSNPHNPASPSISADIVDMELEKCEDVDLLSVSCKLAHLSLDVIGECLGLQESQVQDALSRVSDRHQDHNKVHLLLMKWRELNQDGATESALVQCLQRLPNPEGKFTPSKYSITTVIQLSHFESYNMSQQILYHSIWHKALK